MKLTKAELIKIIKEEYEAVMEQDPQAMMVRGAKGAGRDPFSVEKIRINPDGSFKARLKSAQLEKPLRVAGDLDHNSVVLLHQAVEGRDYRYLEQPVGMASEDKSTPPAQYNHYVQ